VKHFQFLGQFLDNKQVGAVWPSSKYLIHQMIKPIDFTHAKLIIEYGPGTGNITRALLKKMQPDSKLIVFEINNNFMEGLNKIDDKRLTIFNCPAEKASQVLAEHHLGSPDYVVSSLPLAIIPNNTVTRILAGSYSILKTGKAMIQFQYSPSTLGRFKRMFDRVDVKFAPINVPPALVYVCWKK